MSALALFVRLVDDFSDRIGRLVSWLTIGVVAVCFSVVVLRYAFSIGFVWMQDLYVWLHAAVFTLGASYALRHEHHVRVDIIYHPASPRYKAIVNLIGVCLFLLPLVAVVSYYGWPYVMRSWGLFEASSNVGGMPGLFVLKTCVLAFVWLVGLQGLSLAARSIVVLGGRQDLLPGGTPEADVEHREGA